VSRVTNKMESEFVRVVIGYKNPFTTQYFVTVSNGFSISDYKSQFFHCIYGPAVDKNNTKQWYIFGQHRRDHYPHRIMIGYATDTKYSMYDQYGELYEIVVTNGYIRNLRILLPNRISYFKIIEYEGSAAYNDGLLTVNGGRCDIETAEEIKTLKRIHGVIQHLFPLSEN
jgi:hypothetical protein